MSKQIKMKTRLDAVQDYIKSGDSLRHVAMRHGMSAETLRRYLGDVVRARGKNGALPKDLKSRPSVIAKQSAGFFNQSKRWSKLEDDTLVEAVRSGMTVEETVGLLGRTPASIYTRKHTLVRTGVLDERFAIPEGIKRTRHPKEDSPEVEEIRNEVPEVDTDLLTGLSLERLADIVNKYGVNLSLNISGGVTTVQMEKR